MRRRGGVLAEGVPVGGFHGGAAHPAQVAATVIWNDSGAGSKPGIGPSRLVLAGSGRCW
jgi:hypothetical protein